MKSAFIQDLKHIFHRDLGRLHHEIAAYQQEAQLWIVDKHINNCAGNLCLHLIGNLNTYIAADLGGSGYIRQRDAEFNQKDVPQAVLLAQINATQIAVSEALDQLNPAMLEQPFPKVVFKTPMTTAFFLIHLTTHLTYHLGQINYHRRLLADQ